ncbi:hypothetical protein J2755_000135 [Methanohalophilus levihalophilus]|uniref:methyltransferase domain-containing protein n=1 Tax=Methanohalophilus levihalophilus TaxID=1431282 RepID=UPI001AE405A0|nr:class I SAM-dependent methyltransferase [Methanohalophilus levihalophilus]MBP2029215.1 hypothetical protein [Methanohalophilus levihalophilus]
MARKKKYSKEISADKPGLRFATPEEVAEYRAKRLKCNILADISCGIGGQTIAFAKQCEKVFAIDLDPVKVKHARENCRRYGITNVEFFCGDALSREIISKIPEVDIIFSDPARPPSEERRDIRNLQPPIDKVMEAYAHKTTSFAFEVPPQLTPERIPFSCEKEYLSFKGKLNRLNLYFGDLKKCDISATTLPSEETLCSTGSKTNVEEAEKLEMFAFEPDPVILQAGLLGELSDSIETECSLKAYIVDSKRMLLTSKNNCMHPFFKNCYEVTDIVDPDPTTINQKLRQHKAGNALLRGNVNPKHYWEFRNIVEDGLEGETKFHLFLTPEKAIICRKI